MIDATFKDSLKLDNFNFTHIKNSKIINNLFEFSGHFHPKVSIIFNRVTYSLKCFVLGKNFCILPSFGTYTGGLNINSNTLKKISFGVVSGPTHRGLLFSGSGPTMQTTGKVGR